MNILVTGGAGFIGSHVCDALVRDGYAVTAVDNLSRGTRKNIAHLGDRVRFIEADVADPDAVLDIFRAGGFQTVFHFAANSDIAGSHRDPGVDCRNTFLSTYTILGAMRRCGVPQIVFPSSSAVYGIPCGPLAEDNCSLAPVSHYGAAKLASEAFLCSFAHQYGIQAWIVRFPNVVGARVTHGVVHDFIRKLRADPGTLEVLGDGAQSKPYLHVDDLLDAVFFIWKHADRPVNVFNVGPESTTTVRDIACMVAEEMGVRPRITFTGGAQGWPGDVPRFEYDLRKIHALGWRARCNSDEAVRRSIRKILKTT